MKISGILVLIALGALTLVAGCTTSSSGQPQSGAAPTVTSAGMASPFDQPLMATGGDLVMLRIESRAIAG
jgi:hypothetical protein